MSIYIYIYIGLAKTINTVELNSMAKYNYVKQTETTKTGPDDIHSNITFILKSNVE